MFLFSKYWSLWFIFYCHFISLSKHRYSEKMCSFKYIAQNFCLVGKKSRLKKLTWQDLFWVTSWNLPKLWFESGILLQHFYLLKIKKPLNVWFQTWQIFLISDWDLKITQNTLTFSFHNLLQFFLHSHSVYNSSY